MSKINSRDRRRKIRSLHRREQNRCHWCHIELDFRGVYHEGWRGHPELGWLPTLDHFVPSSLGGGNTIKNLVLACDWCNQKRGNMSPNQFRKWLKKNLVPEEMRRRRKL